MSIHKLTAGSGYDYLTRQVAALDATEKGHLGLASYYTERGETPGVWMGSGLAGIDGLNAGDVVTIEQMRALFGAGLHPLAAQRQQQLQGPNLTVRDYQSVTRLGAPFKIYQPDVSPFRIEVAKRIAAFNQAAGLPGDWAVPAADRARIRTEVAREFFVAEHGRQPEDARELAATIAKHSRPRTQAVAGYDLTFSPVKSVSALWAVADPSTAAAIERAHRAAVGDALRFIEQHALYTRLGTNGVRQVEVRGIVAAAFTHRDSRAGDPDLHTHVAVANKVQTRDGRWLSIDGRILFKATVAASETYNTALENHLRAGLGIRFTERPNPDPRLRPVREIVGIDPCLNARWSTRRASIQIRRGELAADFQQTHGRPPTPVESLKLAQQATLETRDAKHEPRTLTEQKAAWLAQASEVLGGGPQAVQRMVHTALHPNPIAGALVNTEWVKDAAGRILAAMEEHRSTWQIWHVRAEAQRQVRALQLQPDQSQRLVDLLVGDVLKYRSVSLARPDDGITEPAALRRSDGTSVYTVAGSDLFTSTRILDAEQRLVNTAGRYDGHTISPAAVDAALLQATANGVTLNAGQAALVRQMATSEARLQLAIAAAGTGKTTAMQTLAAAWTEAGGTVLGLAPSAAAAAQLRDQINTHTDTLAKLTWSAGQHDLPDWARRIGPSTLVVIDEAGMADTLTLDAAVHFIIGRGGSVRLVGDDQQLAAIGAGGVLRDIAHTHGALRLTELHRFTDPAEGFASLALRDGRPEALGFYLDQRRVHVGDLTTLTEDVFSAWQTDRSSGLDAIMLAPTRDLVNQLNQRARAHRLTTEPNATEPEPVRVAMLADGNPASVGEQVITRTNNRTLRMTATDWVKNGDRWTVLKVSRSGDLTVRHHRNGYTVRLPASYVTESVELGYATTVHTAQGVTADTMHGLVAGAESRQQLYTMLTRGRIANHLYLQVVGDGDPHSLIRPETVHPSTATELLEQILARDDAARSATTLQRDQHDPAVQLADAAARYVDALQMAAEDLAGPEVVKALDVAAKQIMPGLTDEPAWPTLRAHLLLLAAHGTDPVAQLAAAAGSRELNSADDQAAVLDWRLDDTGHRNAGQGPLPWLPGIPQGLRDHPVWGNYLARRSDQAASLADQVRATAADTDPPAWVTQRDTMLPSSVVGEVQVWRAAMQVSSEDRRPTGPVQLQKAARTWQVHLDRQVAGDRSPALQEWGWLLNLSPNLTTDPFAPMLADRLVAISHAGMDAGQLLCSTITAGGPLPDDHAAAAVWWRISRHLTPTVTAQADADHTVTTVRSTRLTELIGADRADSLQASVWWPPLVTAVDHALQRGWRLNDLLGAARIDAGSVDAAQALVWRTSLLADPIPTDEDPGEPLLGAAPPDLRPNTEPPSVEIAFGARDDISTRPATTTDALSGAADRDWGEPDLAVAALVRSIAGRPEQTDADVNRMFTRAIAWQECPISRDRIIEINQLALSYFRSQFPSSWGQAYLVDRFGQDLTDDVRFRLGQAPAGWTGLVSHLRSRGVTGEEMTAAGVASTGRLIDRFRDRVIFPIIHNGEILGFVGRRHPDLGDTDRGGPKYLNTTDTPLFHKGAQLFGANAVDTAAGGAPVIVEGPMDAIAVTLAGGGRYIGVAPLGTSLTDEQASQLAAIGKNPIVATDADTAGRVAAERDFWILAAYRLDARYAQLPEGSDPADLLALNGPAALTTVLDQAPPLGDELINERLTNLPPEQAQLEAARVLAARPPECWDQGSNTISSRLNLPLPAVRRTLLAHVKEWNNDPRRAAANPLQAASEVKRRLAEAAPIGPEQRWATLAGQLDQRLPRQGDWPALAQLMQRIDDQGHDVAAVTRAVTTTPLNDLPAQDLRYRLAAHHDLGDDLQHFPVHTPTAKTTTRRPRPHREAAESLATTTRTPPR